ncbi:hypothetical protein F4677DRAFT_120098 [Hypoxylon crocopeplum]|nr:hypothetical protein F4677DRAFT_120098 [Hypoxylon crocopeplum]
MDKLAPSTSFEFLNYSTDSEPLPESKHSLSVKKDAFWSYGGPLLCQPDDLPPSLQDWAAATLSSSIVPLLLPLLSFVNDFVAKNGLDHYWLTIRATRATAEFDKPRWHTDDMFFSDCAEKGKRRLDLQTDWKLCATLLGPTTMFIPAEHQTAARTTSLSTRRALATDHACTSIRCVGCAATADAVRNRLAGELAPLGLVQPAPGEASVFRIGQERGAVHSEPCMSRGDRIFVNIVPGKKDELTNLMTKWGMNFPRSWWVAPNVLRGHDSI